MTAGSEHDDLKRRIAELERELVAVRGSLSWRITQPLRAAKRLARGRRRLPAGYTTTVINGGLGNQMFQYAAGLRVARQTGTRLRVDVTSMGEAWQRAYELEAFFKPENVVSRPKTDYALLKDEALYAEFAADRYGAPVVRERNTGRADELDDLTSDSVLVGYWQSERYIKGVEAELKQLFRARKIGARAREIERAIDSADVSVAVHVRRGDYLTNVGAMQTLGFLGAEYYRAAADLVTAELGEVSWFVFSDEPEWCRENLELEGPVTIVSGDTTGPEDMHLISCCDHAVVANSSFSWWGAWLGETDESLIVAPEVWCISPEVLETPGRVPGRWRRIGVRQGSPVAT